MEEGQRSEEMEGRGGFDVRGKIIKKHKGSTKKSRTSSFSQLIRLPKCPNQSNEIIKSKGNAS